MYFYGLFVLVKLGLCWLLHYFIRVLALERGRITQLLVSSSWCNFKHMMALNAAVRLVVGASRRNHSPVLRDVLHWLQSAATAFDCVRGIGPPYFKDVCTKVVDTSSRANLRSAHRGYNVPRTRTQLGWRSFHVVVSTVWNTLPLYLRSP